MSTIRSGITAKMEKVSIYDTVFYSSRKCEYILRHTYTKLGVQPLACTLKQRTEISEQLLA